MTPSCPADAVQIEYMHTSHGYKINCEQTRLRVSTLFVTLILAGVDFHTLSARGPFHILLIPSNDL